MYVVDPRRTSSSQWADLWLGLNVGTDIALANAVGREIIAAGLENRAFIDGRRVGRANSRSEGLGSGLGGGFGGLGGAEGAGEATCKGLAGVEDES